MMPQFRQPSTRLPDAGLRARCFGVQYDTGHRVGAHRHAWDQIVATERGVLHVVAEGAVWLVPPRRLLLVRSGVEHRLRCPGPVELRTLYLHPGRLDLRNDACEARLVSPLLAELLLHAVRLGRLRAGNDHEERCFGLILDLVDRAGPTPVELPLPHDPRGLQAARRLLADPGDRASVDELARAAGASRRTLERVFRAETGLTVGRWRRRARLLHSVELLLAGHDVTSVGLRVGYESTSAFITRFKALFGVTPGRYGGPR